MNPFSLLTRRHFPPLFVTQFLGAFNGNLFKNACIVVILPPPPEGRAIRPWRRGP